MRMGDLEFKTFKRSVHAFPVHKEIVKHEEGSM